MANAFQRAARFVLGPETARTLFGYDAISSNNRRKAASNLLRSEDAEATENQRRQLVATSRDLVRNFTIAKWMIRRHLDYVTTFHFQAKTDNKALNKRLEELLRLDSKAENFDRAGRHTLPRSLRIAEACRTIDGDVLAIRMSNGTVQWVEGDRIRLGMGELPAGLDKQFITHGIQVDGYGATKAYAISRRQRDRGLASLGTDSSFTFERMVPAANAYLHAYYDRFDQVRGVSPITSALNEMRDVYESFDSARARQKVAELFGLVIKRDKTGDPDDDGPRTEKDENGDYIIDFGLGPQILNLDPGDDASFLENKTPSLESQQFWQTMISVSMKALDLPYSFYAENFTNYSGSRGAIQIYDRSALTKREDNRELLDWWTRWRMTLHLVDGELPGASPDALRWLWIPRGMPWIDPLKEVLSNKENVGMACDTRTRILREQGLEFEDVVAELASEAKLLRDAGLPLNLDSNNALIAALTNDANQPTQAA